VVVVPWGTTLRATAPYGYAEEKALHRGGAILPCLLCYRGVRRKTWAVSWAIWAAGLEKDVRAQALLRVTKEAPPRGQPLQKAWTQEHDRGGRSSQATHWS